MSDDEERRRVPPLDEDEVAWVRSEIRQRQAMGIIAKKARNILTFAVLIIGAFALFWDKFKALVKAAVQ